MNDKLIERLKKLLALSGNNPSVAEAEAAMQKAQAIALEHGIDLAFIGEHESETESEIIREEMEFGKRLPTVNTYVSNILIDFFNVRMISTGGRNNGRSLVFVGKREAVQTAKYVYTWLADTMVRCWHNYYHNTHGAVLDQKQSYLIGFYRGLSAKLATNKENVVSSKLTNDADKTKYALSCVSLSEKIQDFIDDEFGKLGKASKKKVTMDAASYASGHTAGSNCNIAKGGLGSNRVAGFLS